MALLHYTRLYITLQQWLYFTLLDSTLLHYNSSPLNVDSLLYMSEVLYMVEESTSV